MTREDAIKIFNTILLFGKCDCPKEEIEECFKMAIKALEQEPQKFKWCTDCREYDQEKHCCHRWSKVIRNTVEEMKQEYIEREVLDKIRAEIEELRFGQPLRKYVVDECLEIIDNVQRQKVMSNDNSKI